MSLDDCSLVFAALNLVLLGYTWTVLQEVIMVSMKSYFPSPPDSTTFLFPKHQLLDVDYKLAVKVSQSIVLGQFVSYLLTQLGFKKYLGSS